jgi:hypothetical protein
LASYSDDELNNSNTNSRKLSKEERRRSKDDAWVDILVASHARRAGNQDAELRRPGGPRTRNNASRQDPELASLEVAQVLAGVRGPSPPFDGESVDNIEPMNVPHRSKIDSLGSPLEELELYAPTIPESVDLTVRGEEDVREGADSSLRPQRRVGYFDLHPERRQMRVGGGDGDGDGDNEDDIFDQFARAADQSDDPDRPRRSDVTESVYSSGPTPPASPHRAEHRQPEPAAAFPSSSLPSPSAPSAQTPVYSPRDLQRQQEVRDRLSGKPGPKASSLIEMYREKERQATGGSPGSKSSSPAAAATMAAKETTPLPPPPPSEPFLSPVVDMPSSLGQEEGEEEQEQQLVVVVEEEEGEFTEPEPHNFEFDHGRDSPYRYVHGAPLHNVVEEEEEIF